ncbi:MAG: alpha/beta hydrolase [Synergistaceae bacterium]|nr:alpha/beta hydrolase [Synergistaceae bacterium]
MKINYCDEGSGEAVLFLHGWGSDFSVFRNFIDGLSGYCRAVALDLPGFGGSDEPPRGWSVDDYADFVVDFLTELGVSGVISIGHSFGGRITIKLAARRDERLSVSKAVLIDSAGVLPRRSLRQRAKAKLYKAGKLLLSANAVQKKFPRLIESWRERNGSSDYRNASPRMRECLVKIVGEDLAPCLPDMRCPTLLVWGENDTETPLRDARTMEKLIPDAGLVVLENAGHFSFLDQSYTFGRVLDSFLNIERRPA